MKTDNQLKIKKSKDRYYDYSNLISADHPYENTDTFFIDLSKISTEIIQSGNVTLAKEFVSSEVWQEFLNSLSRIPGYISTAYTYNCVSAYIIALGVLSSYSEAGRLLAKLTNMRMSSSEEYKKGMSETIIAFTAIVEKEKSKKRSSVYVRRTSAYISDHLYVRFSLEDLAAYCGCSLSYLRHRFKEETGVSLVQYIQEKKIDMAKKMLATGHYTCSQISSQLGFCSESYFITVFKKYTGTTPKRYMAATERKGTESADQSQPNPDLRNEDLVDPGKKM